MLFVAILGFRFRPHIQGDYLVKHAVSVEDRIATGLGREGLEEGLEGLDVAGPHAV